MILDTIVEDLVALRLDRSTVRKTNPLHGLVVAAEAVTDMEASRFREAIDILEAVSPSTLDRDYRAVREAVLTWASGDLLGARELLATSLRGLTGERALLAGFLAHMADFYLGDEGGMLDTGRMLIERRPTMSRRAAGLSEGLFSFALEECGHHSEAIASAERALSTNHDDVYALHAKVHALQNLNENIAARATISSYSNGWGTKEPMRIHMWWHYAISLIREGELDQVLLCYDLEVRRKRRACALEDLDAVALLWRLDLLGDEDLSKMLAPRWRMLARAWKTYAADSNYIFNDLHAAMAFAKVEDHCLFDKVVESCQIRESPDFFHSVCAPLFLGIAAVVQQDYATTVRVMSPVLKRRQLQIGGSKLQQSIFHRTRDAADSFLRGSKPRNPLSSHIHSLTKES
jgi:tetratricopeptide (TPR) repeat protein